MSVRHYITVRNSATLVLYYSSVILYFITERLKIRWQVLVEDHQQIWYELLTLLRKLKTLSTLC